MTKGMDKPHGWKGYDPRSNPWFVLALLGFVAVCICVGVFL
jgi:hypothetical protein